MGGFITFLAALAVTTALLPLLIRLAAPLGFVDRPNARKVHSNIVPRIGGVAMVIGVTIAALIGLERNTGLMALLSSIGILAIAGILDDRFDLSYQAKLVGQIVAAFVIVTYGDVLVQRIPFLDSNLPDWIAVPFTILILLATTNAINLSDGLDGLAGGVTLLSLGTIALLAHSAEAWTILITSLAVIGSVFGFLRFNTHPATVFMGDTGSQFLGFIVGVLTIQLTQSAAPALSSVLPFMLLGLPIIDTLMVMAQRIGKGLSPFHADRNHIHHKLLELEFDHYEAVMVIYVIQAVFVILGFTLRYQWDALVLSIYVISSFLILLVFRLALWSRWRFRGRDGKERTHYFTRYFEHWRRRGYLSDAAMAYIVVVIGGYLLFAVIYPKSIPYDVGMLAGGMAAMQFVFLLLRGANPMATIERIGFYVTAGLAIYLMQLSPGIAALGGKGEQVLFLSVVIAGLVAIRYSTQPTQFRLTPLDLLMVTVAIVMPQLFASPGKGMLDWQLGLAKLIVLFYAIELVLGRLGHWHRELRMTQMVVLAIAGIRAILNA
jgi:UDP-GlcNAc:undecaprenyl-phosphate/decaprenyl-phosphate GlcNAc-1-phosphate transferase